jgi:hypothetical protein
LPCSYISPMARSSAGREERILGRIVNPGTGTRPTRGRKVHADIEALT